MAGEKANVIYIKKNFNIFCMYCYYIIEVMAEEFDMDGYINILLEDDAIWLMEGRALMDSLAHAIYIRSNNDGEDSYLDNPVNIYRLSVPNTESIKL